jgi:protocatechuate 3,4-dioxygenase beta subunit
MRNLNQSNIAEAFLHYCNQTGKAPDEDANSSKPADAKTTNNTPRTMEVMACLAKHLHAFALEIRLTHAEWNAGVEFMRQVGEKTTPARDEFILLSDVLGLSSLVDLIHNHQNVQESIGTTTNAALKPTSSSVLGPFHLDDPPTMNYGADLKRDNGGELLLVQGNILNAQTASPVSNAKVNVWQTAPNGMYCSQDPQQEQYNFHGLISATADGRYAFTTSKPVPYQIPTDGPVGNLLGALGRHAWRPSHLHLIVQADGYHTLVTEIFPEDDPYLEEDAVFGVREDLVIVNYTKQSAKNFPKEDFDLCGKVEDDFLLVKFDLVLLPCN